MNLTDLERAICCEGSECLHPEGCYLRDPARAVTVRPRQAALAVHKLLCENWRETEQQRRAKPVEGAFW
jgi:hypothetical protein